MATTSRLLGILSRVRSAPGIYRRAGLGGVLGAISDRIYRRDDFVVLRRDLRREAPRPLCSLDFCLARIDDDQLARFKEMPPPFPRHYDYRFEYAQRRCYGAFVGETIVALMWPSFEADNDRIVSRWRVLLPDEARIGSIWADPRYRGTGLMAACIDRFARYLAARGIRYLYACTWVNNHASIRIHEKLGFQLVGTVRRYSFRWQKEGRGLYARTRMAREPVAPDSPRGDIDLPDVIG